MVATARTTREADPMTTTLSNAQRAILTGAVAVDDRLVRPEHVPLKGGAIRIVLISMLRRGLLEELPAGEGEHSWWSGAADEPLALRVTDAGAEAVGALSDTASPGAAVAAPADAPEATTRKAFRADTKQAAMIALLRRPEGATIDEMVAATGWLSHTVRGAMAGSLKKRLGMEITSQKVEGRGRVYKVAPQPGQTGHS